MSSLTLGGGSPALTFNLASQHNFSVPIISDSGNLSMNGNVAVTVMNFSQTGTTTLLQYSGTRSGSGSFVTGTVPAGATIVDDTVNRRVQLNYIPPNSPRVVIPTFNTNEVVVAVATPQQYGAVGDGITD